MSRRPLSVLPLLALLCSASTFAQTPAMAPDIGAAKFEASLPGADYIKQVVMIPMRDGVKLLHRDRDPEGRQRTRRSC